MGALPKRRISTRRKGKRRRAIKLNVPKTITCANCGQLRKSHQTCPSCGYYKGKEVFKIKVKKEKKSAKDKEKQSS